MNTPIFLRLKAEKGTGAKRLNAAVKEYKSCLTRVGTTPLIVWIWGQGFVVTYYHSVWWVKKHGWWVCNENIIQRNLYLINR